MSHPVWPELKAALKNQNIALSCAVQIVIGLKDPMPDGPPFRSATGTVLYLGGVPYLVTNKHVIDAYRDFLRCGSSVFEFAGVSIEPLSRLHSEDETVDLAAITLTNLRIRTDRSPATGTPSIAPYEPKIWPPESAREGDGVFVAGWPEVTTGRGEEPNEIVSSAYAFTGLCVCSVMDDQFKIKIDRSEARGLNGSKIRSVA